MKSLRPASRQLHTAFNEYKLAAAMRDKKAVGVGSSAVAKTGDLKKVYRFKDVTQLSVLCREMRKWDEDGVPDPETTEYGDFLLKVWPEGSLGLSGQCMQRGCSCDMFVKVSQLWICEHYPCSKGGNSCLILL